MRLAIGASHISYNIEKQSKISGKKATPTELCDPHEKTVFCALLHEQAVVVLRECNAAGALAMEVSTPLEGIIDARIVEV